MRCGVPDGLGLTTAVNTLAVALADCLSDEEAALVASVLNQLGDTLATIAAQRVLCEKLRAGKEAAEQHCKNGAAP